jgi:mRNA interferase MazF
MNRGQLLIAVLSGDLGKPRPAVLVQGGALFEAESLLICPMTSDVGTASRFRPLIEPTAQNGLREPSVIMTDKVTAVPRRRCRERIGELTPEQIADLDTALMFVLGLD